MITKKLLGEVSEVFLYIFLLFVFFATLSSKLPTKNFLQVFVVPTGSMNPTVPPGSLVFVRTHQREQIRVGDVVAFNNPNDHKQTVLHRIIDEKEGGFVTKGDANSSADLWLLRKEMILGKLGLTLPLIGFLVSAIKSPLGFIALVVIPSIALSVQFVYQIKSGISEMSAKSIARRIGVYSIASLAIGFSISATSSQALALFTDEVSLNRITFQFSTLAPSPVPTPTPTISPTTTPLQTNTPTPTSLSDCPLDIVIEGNGAGSVNEVEVLCINHTVIVMANDLKNVSQFNISYTYKTLGITQSIKSSNNIDGEASLRREFFEGSCSDEACIPHKAVTSRTLRLFLNRLD